MPPTYNGIFQDGAFSCGFDMAPTAAQVFTRISGGTPASVGARGGSGFAWSQGGGSVIGRLLLVNLATLISGWALNVSALPSVSASIAQWYDTTAAGGQLTLRLFNDGHLQFFLGTSATAVGPASAAGLVVAGAYVYLETKVTINGSTGAVELRINGSTSPVITGSGLNTKNTANAWVNAFDFVGASAGTNLLDDWYMLDMTGAAPLNDFLGNVQAKGDKSNANSAVGGRNAFSPTNPTNVNWSNVANAPINTAEHNDDLTVGDYDMFRFPSVPGATVFFVNIWNQSNLDIAGARTIGIDGYSGGTDFISQNLTPPVTPSVSLDNLVLVKDPGTGSAWTPTNAGNMECGVKVTS